LIYLNGPAPIISLKGLVFPSIKVGVRQITAILRCKSVKKWLSAIIGGDGSTSWYGKKAHESVRSVFVG